MSYRDRPRMWKVAYWLLVDEGPSAVPLGDPVVQRCKGGGKAWQEWAIDMRNLCHEGMLPYVDEYYLRPSNEYVRIPLYLKPTLYKLWKRAESSGLFAHGIHIVAQCYLGYYDTDDEDETKVA